MRSRPKLNGGREQEFCELFCSNYFYWFEVSVILQPLTGRVSPMEDRLWAVQVASGTGIQHGLRGFPCDPSARYTQTFPSIGGLPWKWIDCLNTFVIYFSTIHLMSRSYGAYPQKLSTNQGLWAYNESPLKSFSAGIAGALEWQK